SKTREKRQCVQLSSMPDGIAYVSATKELWATTPRDQTLTIVDLKGKEPSISGTIKLEGDPEGYAVDDARGVFYTNLEDKDKTLSIDIRTRQVTRTWLPGCGEDGPKGLAVDHRLDFLFVACRDRVMVLDAGHDGKRLSAIEVG